MKCRNVYFDIKCSNISDAKAKFELMKLFLLSNDLLRRYFNEKFRGNFTALKNLNSS